MSKANDAKTNRGRKAIINTTYIAYVPTFGTFIKEETISSLWNATRIAFENES